MRRRILATTAMAAVFVLVSAGTASAHECFIANRSAQGNAGATHSDNWIPVSVVEFANSPDFPPGVDPECFIDFWLGNGGPESFTVRSDKTIGEGSSNPNLGDGTGLDHIEDAYGELLGAALGACQL
jgi:hypothetical protein